MAAQSPYFLTKSETTDRKWWKVTRLQVNREYWNHDAFFSDTLHITEIPFFSYVEPSGPRGGAGLAQNALPCLCHTALCPSRNYSPMSFNSRIYNTIVFAQRLCNTGLKTQSEVLSLCQNLSRSIQYLYPSACCWVHTKDRNSDTSLWNVQNSWLLMINIKSNFFTLPN